MRLVCGLVFAVSLGLVGTEYAAVGIACLGLVVALYAHVRLGRVSEELNAVAAGITEKARTIERELGDPDLGP